MASLFNGGRFQGFDSAGNPLSAGQLFTYAAGTLTPLATYTTQAGNVANANPVVLDSAGRAPVWLAASSYRMILKTAAGVTVTDDDNISPYPGEAVTFIAAGTGAVARTMQDKGRERISVMDFGAIGDGVTDDTLSIVRAAAALSSGQTLDFGDGVYLVSQANAGNVDAYGKKVMYLSGLEDITIKGSGATIKCNSHDIATNGGLVFLWGISCRRVRIEGLYFDMTFTGVKNSASFYPFCGAIVFPDAPTGAKTQGQLSGDISISDCAFKLYHPFGQFATTTAGNEFAGDNNNGFKIFAAFISGDYLATAYANQNRGLKFKGLTFKDGHNAYGCWAWAYNNVSCDQITAEAWVSKSSTNAGVLSSGGVAMIRYHQWHCTGVSVTGCHFRAKPCSERLTAGYQGAAIFVSLDTNLTGDYAHGKALVSGNTILLGNGDSASAQEDFGVYVTCFGDVSISGNTFDGSAVTTNGYDGRHIFYGAGSNGANGKGSLSITSNTFGVNSSYINSISLFNGATVSEYARRLKSLIVSDNISMSQAQYFLDMETNSASVFYGVRHAVIDSNIVVGTHNTIFGAASTNSRAFRLAGSESTDILICRDNIIKDKYYAFICTGVNAAATALLDNNKTSGVTSFFLGGSLVDCQTASGAFTPLVSGGTTAGVGTYTKQIGRFQRIGARCMFEVSVTITAHTGTGSFTVDLNNIPYSSKNIDAAHGVGVSVVQSTLVVGAGKEVGAAVQNNSKSILLYAMDQAGGAIAPIAIDPTTTLYLSGWFEVS